jgi:ribonuclease VapC
VIVDASALLAIVFSEPERDRFLEIADSAGDLTISVINFVEAGIKVDRDADARRAPALDKIVAEFAIGIAPVTVEQGRLARQAHEKYGRGSGHPARLNLGDCFAYALARMRREPLLFKGDDFTRTDIEAAI